MSYYHFKGVKAIGNFNATKVWQQHQKPSAIIILNNSRYV